MIASRLRSGFYRSIEGLLWDAQLISTDARLFNQEGTQIVLESEQVVEKLTKLVKSEFTPWFSRPPNLCCVCVCVCVCVYTNVCVCALVYCWVSWFFVFSALVQF
jgi:hypothetical protein